MLLACDLSLSSGFAIGEPKSLPRTLTVKLYNELPRALYGLRSWVYETCRAEGIDFVAIEKVLNTVVYGSGGAHRALLMTSLQAVTIEAAWASGVRRIELVPVQTWRKHWIGRGDYPREEAKRRAMQRCDQLGILYDSDDAAEAAGIHDYVSHKFFGRQALL